MAHSTSKTELKELLRGQMKRIMEHRFMFVHTLEEAEFNRVVSDPTSFLLIVAG